MLRSFLPRLCLRIIAACADSKFDMSHSGGLAVAHLPTPHRRALLTHPPDVAASPSPFFAPHRDAASPEPGETERTTTREGYSLYPVYAPYTATNERFFELLPTHGHMLIYDT